MSGGQLSDEAIGGGAPLIQSVKGSTQYPAEGLCPPPNRFGGCTRGVEQA